MYKWGWRFDRQPFELRLDLQAERPTFDVRTRGVLTADADRLVLDLDCQVQVHSGRLSTLILKWPAPGIDRWACSRHRREWS